MGKKKQLQPDLKNYWGETFDKPKPTGTCDKWGVLLEGDAFDNVGLALSKGKMPDMKDWSKLPEGSKNYYRRCYRKVNLP